MTCLLLPKSLGTQLESICAKFWWGKGLNKRGVRWHVWLKLCFPKDVGGLNFRSLAHFNLSLLAKQGWRLLNIPDSLLARSLKSKYYRDTDFLGAQG